MVRVYPSASLSPPAIVGVMPAALRRFFTLAAGLALMAAVAVGSAGRGAFAAWPLNVIVIVVDDLGWGNLGAHGYPHAWTAAIDRLVRTGCAFDPFYVVSPVCSPSRAGFDTERIQNRFGMQGKIDAGARELPAFHRVRIGEPTLPGTVHR